MQAKPRRGEVIVRRPLTARVTELTLRLSESEPFRWRPGQYLALVPPDRPEERHHYSIASAPDPETPNRLELAIANEAGAEVLAAAVPGAAFGVVGPLGELALRSSRAALFVGAGTGVVPLRALVRAALAAGFEGPLRLLAGSRTREELLWQGELAELARARAAFDYQPVLSRPDDAWSGRRGYVQEHLVAVAAGMPAASEAYICGSTSMVRECRELLATIGFTGERVQSEAYS